MSLHIAVVAALPFPYCQGSQILIEQSSRALQKRGHKITILTYGLSGIQTLTDLKIERIPNFWFYKKFRAGPSLFKPILDLLMVFKLFFMIKTKKIDIIHAHNYEGAIISLLVGKIKKIPIIFHTHNILEEELPYYFRNKLIKLSAKWFGSVIDQIIPGYCDFNITVNEYISSFIKHKGVKDNRIQVIYPGIEFPPDEIFTGVKRNFMSLVYTGNLDSYQNILVLFKSFLQVLKKYPDAILEIVTDSDTTNDEIKVRNLGIQSNVQFFKTSSFEEVKSKLLSASIGLCPRISCSGFPIKNLNYMAYGIPVVSFRGSSWGIENGRQGLIAENNDLNGFSSNICKLLASPGLTMKMGQNAREKIKEKFSWELKSREIEDIYQKII